MGGLDVGRGLLKWTPVLKQGAELAVTGLKSHAVVGNLYDGRIEGNVTFVVDDSGSDGTALAVLLPAPAAVPWVVGAGRWTPASGNARNVTVQIAPNDGFDFSNPLTYNAFWFLVDDDLVLDAGAVAGDALAFHFNYPVAVYSGGGG